MLSTGAAEEVELTQLTSDCQFLWIEGRPFNEPSIQYGPFVMGTKQEIMQCFEDFQGGRLTTKPATYKRF